MLKRRIKSPEVQEEVLVGACIPDKMHWHMP